MCCIFRKLSTPYANEHCYCRHMNEKVWCGVACLLERDMRCAEIFRKRTLTHISLLTVRGADIAITGSTAISDVSEAPRSNTDVLTCSRLRRMIPVSSMVDSGDDVTARAGTTREKRVPVSGSGVYEPEPGSSSVHEMLNHCVVARAQIPVNHHTSQPAPFPRLAVS